jgi:hypothetical protein
MLRTFATVLLVAILASTVGATTLEKLSVDDLVQKSTLIVRARVLDSKPSLVGKVIYTNYSVQVLESIRGGSVSTVTVSVPGGSFNGIQQRFAGTPKLDLGTEYVLFVWTGATKINHILGLSQGLFTVKLTAQGETVLHRGAIAADIVDASGNPTHDPGMAMTLKDLRNRVRKAAQ